MQEFLRNQFDSEHVEQQLSNANYLQTLSQESYQLTSKFVYAITSKHSFRKVLMQQAVQLSPQLLLKQLLFEHWMHSDCSQLVQLALSSQAVTLPDNLKRRSLELWSRALLAQLDNLHIQDCSDWLEKLLPVTNCLVQKVASQPSFLARIVTSKYLLQALAIHLNNDQKFQELLLFKWCDPAFIHFDSDFASHCFVALSLLFCNLKVKDAHKPHIMKAVGNYLELANSPIKQLGMAMAEHLIGIEFDLDRSDSLIQFVRSYGKETEKQTHKDVEVEESQQEPGIKVQGKYEAYSCGQDSDDEFDIESDNPALKPPQNISAALQYFKLSSKHSDQEYLKLLLEHLPRIILESNQIALFQQLPEVMHRILFQVESYNIKDFEQLRFKCLVEGAAALPQCGTQLIDDLWNSPALSMLARCEVMDVLISAAQRMISFESPFIEARQQENAQIEDTQKSSAQIQMLVASKTKYFHPISHNVQSSVSYYCKSAPLINLWISQLSRGLFKSQLKWLRQSALLKQPQDLLQLLTLYEEQSKEPLEPELIPLLTMQLFSKWMETMSILLRVAGPFGHDTRQTLQQLGHTFQWYWHLCHRIRLDVTDARPLMIQHPQARMPILKCLQTVLFVCKTNPILALDFSGSLLPFQDSIADDQMIKWLMEDVYQGDSDAENRRLAAACLTELKERSERLITN